MHDGAAGAARRPADGTHGSNERWKQVAPAAAVSQMRMPAARALRMRQCIEARPAAAAHHAAFVRGERSLAHDAHARQQKVGDAAGRGAQDTKRVLCAQR